MNNEHSVVRCFIINYYRFLLSHFLCVVDINSCCPPGVFFETQESVFLLPP